MPPSILATVANRAEKLVRGALEATSRSPSASRLMLAVRHAEALEREWKLDEATTRWQAIAVGFPDAPIAAIGYARVLRQQNRCDETNAVLAAARLRFPLHWGVLREQALVARQQARHDDALALARVGLEHHADRPGPYELAGEALRELKRYDEAEAMLDDGRRRCPRSLGIAAQRAVVADARGDWMEALARWQAVRHAFPDAALPYAGEGAALKRLKRYAEADAVLTAGMQRFPEDSNLGVNYGWSADDSGDWQESLRRWSALKGRFPGDPRIRTGWIESQGKANLARADLAAEGAAVPADGTAPADEAMPWRDLFMRFESLGENCELGFAQRHFGAEPPGLLRWSGVSYGKLVDGLDAGFAGVGTPEQTDMNTNPSNHEYYTTDKVYGMDMHTFIIRDEGNENRIYQKLCRRLQYLRVKLLDDLAAAEKIFVFQTGGSLSDDDMRRLHQPMRRHGPAATLLVVQPPDGSHTPGTIRIVEEGLIAGTIDRVGFDGHYWTISFDLWRQLCQQAVAIDDGWRAGR